MQFHPTGMVWPPSVRGTLITEGVRGEGGTLRNKDGKRIMFGYIPELYANETASTEDEADQWLRESTSGVDVSKAKRTPDLLPRDIVARAIHTEVKAGRGSPHGGVFLDIYSRRSAEDIKRKLPAMYHQFKELGRRRHHEGADGGRPDRRTTRWAASASIPRRRSRASRASSRPASARRACTGPTGSAATRCRTCSSSGASRGCTRRSYAKATTSAPRARRRRDRRRDARGAGAVRPRRGARTRSPCTRTSRTRCRASSASSAPRTT